MGTRIGYVAGSIDPFSRKHLSLLHHARLHCDTLVAGIVSDEWFRDATGVSPSIPARKRVEILRELDGVDEVFVETTSDPMAVWREVYFTHLFVGRRSRSATGTEILEHTSRGYPFDVVSVTARAHVYTDGLWRAVDAITRCAPAVVG